MGRTLRTAGTTLALLLATATPAPAHGGGLDAHGCHHNRIEGGYHCHRGPLAGRDFASREAARLAEWLVGLLAVSPRGAVRLGAQVPVLVLDGDTIEIEGRRVRLQGIDAPEMAQTCRAGGRPYACGARARQELIRRINETGGVVCEVGDFDRYGRLLGVCRDGRGRDLNAAMVEAGWALAFRRYSDAYAGPEARARGAGAGLWAGTFTAPWEWRQGR